MKAFALFLAAAALPFAHTAWATPAATEYVVREGETLNGIANRAGVSSKAIIDANGLKEPYTVRIGQKLKIPRATTATAVPPKTAAPQAPTPSKPAPQKVAASPSTTRSDRPVVDQKNVHIVQPGETLGGIANRTKVPRILIAEANGLTPPYYVQPGRKLLLPRTRRYVVKEGDTGFDIAYRHAVSWNEIAVANGLDANAAVKPGRELLIPTVLNPPPPSQADLAATRPANTANAVATAAVAASNPATATVSRPNFSWPVSGTVRRGWKARSDSNHHDGIDITAPTGRSVKAAASGTVIFAGSEPEQFGNLVVVDHGNGWNTAYGFLSRISVKNGAKITSGQQVGLVGTTGMARGSELHFEVRQDGVPVNPISALPKAP